MAMKIPLGSPIEGELIDVEISSKNLSNLSFWFPGVDHGSGGEDDGPGCCVGEDGDFKIPRGDSILFLLLPLCVL